MTILIRYEVNLFAFDAVKDGVGVMTRIIVGTFGMDPPLTLVTHDPFLAIIRKLKVYLLAIYAIGFFLILFQTLPAQILHAILISQVVLGGLIQGAYLIATKVQINFLLILMHELLFGFAFLLHIQRLVLAYAMAFLLVSEVLWLHFVETIGGHGGVTIKLIIYDLQCGKGTLYFIISMENIDQQVQLILNSLQLASYCAVLLIAIFKLFYAAKNKQPFLIKFFACVLVITTVQIVIQGLYVAQLVQDIEVQIYKFLIINIYAILMQSLAIFLLSDYWYETRQILTKSSNEVELKQDNHVLRYVILGVWFVVYSVFIGYGLGTNSFGSSDQIFGNVLALGCQGVGMSIMMWAIILQVHRGYTLQKAVARYKSWLNSVSLKTVQFKCLYYISTIVNALRIMFLIGITIMVDIYDKEMAWLYLFVYIYTATNIIVLMVYLFGFSLDQPENNDQVQTLITENPVIQGEETRKKRKQTELSESSAFSSNKE